MKKLIVSSIYLCLLWIPAIIYAQPTPSTGGDPTPVRTAPSGGSSVSLQNPLKSDSLLGFFQSILDAIMVFAVPIIVFFIIYAGFLYVMARGNADGVGKAHRALLYAVIGGLIILGAQIILSIISATVNAF